MKKKALSLLSGGLDSILATRLIMDQGIEVEAVHFMTTFCNCTNKGCRNAAKVASENLKIPLKSMNVTEEYLPIVEHPRHGYGSHMNPCLDCRIFMFKKARRYMEAIEASFIVTGEVLGERPMSQRQDAMLLIERESGLSGLIVRPLTARHFEATIPEKEGIVHREKLLSFRGRARKPQMLLAGELGLNDYPCPAGGCLLTDADFAKRVKDLINHKMFTIGQVRLLRVGRHFRLSDTVKLVVGRNETENTIIEHLAREYDVLLQPAAVPGPTALMRGQDNETYILDAGSIVAHYTKAKTDPSVRMISWMHPEATRTEHALPPAADSFVNSKRA